MMVKNYNKNRVDLFSTTLFPLSLPEVFKRIHYYLYTNSNIPRAERLGAEMTRILFCKIYDELHNEEKYKFKIHSDEEEHEISNRIKALFEEVKKKYIDVFDEEEKLYLDDKSIAYMVNQIQNYKFLNTKRDVISESFQAFWGSGLRGEKGQFFTPRNIVKMCVEILDPKHGEKIIDPACGSGGFLVECMAHLNEKESFNNIFGIDKEIDLAKICKAYMSIVGDGHFNIFCGDSLDVLSWSVKMQEEIKNGSFDVVLTNPPFGARISIEDKKILKNYELGHKWNKTREGKWKNTNIISKQVPQILFIERCLQLLKSGGRMAIVLPDGIFGNPSDRYILQYILQEAKILAIISLAPEAFLPSTHTKTSILFLEKKKPKATTEDYKIFMAIANKVGHDKNGKTAYKMNGKGEYILDKNGNNIIDDDLPNIVERYRLFKENKLHHYDHFGFVIKLLEIKDSILIPNYYDPEIETKLKMMEHSGRYALVSIKELVEKGLLSIKRGNEVGSQYYGMGDIPFVRTSDIVNWEIKIDPIKCIPKEIYEKYKKSQDIHENDILLVTDGTFLIGRTAIATSLDEKIVIQSHIRRIRCLKYHQLHPYLLLYLLNTDIVQQQIKAKTFVQATISTLGNRIYELILPIPKDENIIEEIIKEVSEIVEMKICVKRKIDSIKNFKMEE
ncbi:MAG: N-6 DNA Methylase [Candidatus Methanolliviera sp. GoM_oil]|nr:MAG: N-6 DNA Methylase [Candidatus Methanolliviera sp. GoM_oil]